MLFDVEVDDAGFYPAAEIRVDKGTKVKITFRVRTTNVYSGGLEIRSSKFNTQKIEPGSTKTVEFTANESFEFTSYWPVTNVKKAVGRLIVEPEIE